ncbi:MAG: fumarate hydratase [Dehalococcoidia bacterium]|nr:MAG: fumarate hydratase [Dehalococcoidia bacterium]
MREIDVKEVTQAVARLCQKTNFELGADVLEALRKARERESSPIGKEALDRLLENAQLAKAENLPLCQDCGAAVVFLDIGQDVHLTGGDLYTAVAEGIRQGYKEGYLRKSMVTHPFTGRLNTGDNTPPVIHTEVAPGDKIKIGFMPKGGGAENMSRLVMLRPGAGEQGIADAVVSAVKEAGGNPCPPLIIGLGIGATAEKAMLMAKRALLRPAGWPSSDPETAELEWKVLEAVNKLGIGPLGMGGIVTALAVHAESRPCHFASLPLAINLQCHSARHAEVVL